MDAEPRQEHLYIDGEWESGDDRIRVNDHTGSGPFAEVVAASERQVDAAIEAADGVTASLRGTTIPERAEWLEAIAAGLADRDDELAEIIVREAGKPITSARSEVRATIERFERAIDEARSLDGEYRQGSTSGHEGWQALVTPEPVGVVVAITPYNYPLSTPALRVAPALAAGNSVVLKPASATPVSTAVLTDVIADVGLPDGALNYVPGHGGEIGETLVGDDRVDAIAMTGSSAAGNQVARQSGMVRLHMELGGNAPAVVFPDADLDLAAADCTRGALKYAGQRCSAVSRVLAHEAVHDDLVEKFDAEMDEWRSGDLFAEETSFGPMISESRATAVEDFIEDARERGARLVRGGGREGNSVEPTLLAEVPPAARVITEEQFGPIIPVTTFETREEALAIANGTDLALDACVFTADYERAHAVARRLDAGAVRINGAPSHGIGDVPYGGNRDSGIGREGLGVTIESFLRTKSIVL